MIVRFSIAMVAAFSFLGLYACAIPFPYAPKTQILPDTEPVPLVQVELGRGSKDTDRAVRAIRNGRGISVGRAKNKKEFFASLPVANFAPAASGKYVSPWKYEIDEAGSRHFYGFRITQGFAEATKRFLSGDGEGALRHIDRIFEDPESDPKLLWQSSYLRADVLSMMGRPDLAETEVKRAERLEIRTMGTNHLSRALRAEARYRGGDLEGAADDAGQVVRSIGSWRFPTRYVTPPLDQLELGRINTAQVRAEMVLGLVLIAKGQYGAALPWLELADQTMNDVMYVSKHWFYSVGFRRPPDILWGRAVILTYLGATILGLDPDSERARENFLHAEQYFSAIGFKPGPVLIESFKAQSLIAAKRPKEAQAAALKGLGLAEKLGLIDAVWQLETLRGTALMDLGRWDEAERAFRHAQNVVDRIAGTMVEDANKIRFGVGKDAIIRNLVKIDLRKNQFSRLFENLERSRAQAFVSQLASRVVAAGREEAITSQIRILDKDILRERQKKNAVLGIESVDVSREQSLLDNRVALVAALRERDPDLADALSVAAVSLESVQKMLPVNVAMIYSLPADRDQPLSLLVITKTDVRLKVLSANAVKLRAHLDAFSSSIASANTLGQQAAIEYLREDFDLANWGSARAVYFVPSGDAYFVPWGALNVPFPIAVLPTGSWVARGSLSLSQSAKAAVIGDPSFGGLLAQLPGARAEALAISQQYGTTPLIGEAATEAKLRDQVDKSVDVLHFATHALYDPIYPLQSALIVTDGAKAVPLTAEKLFERPLRAKLVVLSACETGMGHVTGGDELLGLARSFYLGGASSVMASLWPVEDEATSIFMEVFHANSKDGAFGQAWLAARDAVRAKGFPPSSYGAFILGGSLGGTSQ